jgi:hypothetical protein
MDALFGNPSLGTKDVVCGCRNRNTQLKGAINEI